MARDRGPTDRIARRFGVPIFGPSKSLERRPYPPGHVGARGSRRKQSDYSMMLAEKQKLRFQYGVMEKQFRKYFKEAVRRDGITGNILLQLLEMRLDNICYRLGLGVTRRASRQFVNHGHVLVNDRKVDIPSYQVKPGDVIKVAESNRSQQLAMRLIDSTQARPAADWMELDRDKLTAVVNRAPERDEIDPMVNERLVIEYYSR